MKSDKFSKIKKMLSGSKKATAEKEASENPKKFLKKMKNANIKNLKGIAF
jgi:hypothetical protein